MDSDRERLLAMEQARGVSHRRECRLHVGQSETANRQVLISQCHVIRQLEVNLGWRNEKQRQDPIARPDRYTAERLFQRAFRSHHEVGRETRAEDGHDGARRYPLFGRGAGGSR